MIAIHLGIFALALVGFAALAVGTQRYAPQLVGNLPKPRFRKAAGSLGWILLATALGTAVHGLETNGVAIVVWLGWLALAGLLLAFSLPKWPWRQRSKPSTSRRSRTSPVAAADVVPARKPRRWIGGVLVAVTAAAFVGALASVETKPLYRDDAVQGKVGPWTYTFAETDQDLPEVVDMDVPLKSYTIRFCEACDLEIARAYLKVNKPRAARASGMAFAGNNRDRGVEIQLPSNLTGKSELWLTMVGKDGTTHQTYWPIKSISPATVAWFENQRKGQ